ncbi:hypothetical protein ZEAMMB73_Zm00001d011287 [Zea mays]|uniref:Uncharacterized protein n=1 Tax=Zea mays TaxID=4577 RepID=A0A1D6FYM0_MAIZE|nr:hypothetical protein ZEAMMB73_Zm00001d011287 [Zea mays]
MGEPPGYHPRSPRWLPRPAAMGSRVQKATIGGVTIDGLLVAATEFSIGLAFVLIRFFTTQCAPDVFWNQLLAIPLAQLPAYVEV